MTERKGDLLGRGETLCRAVPQVPGPGSQHRGLGAPAGLAVPVFTELFRS